MTTNKNHIADIWEILEKEKALGLVKRLYSSDVLFHVYGTFQYPERYYGVAFSFSNDMRIDISSFDNLRDLKVSLFADTTFVNSKVLIIQLLHPNNRDVFASLCENLIQSVLKLNVEQEVIRAVISQLTKWKTLFDKSVIGLTSAEQQGLYGELHFLQKSLLKLDADFCDVLNTWVGIGREMRDFQGRNWAVEVKTTSTNNPQRVTINGERQLDETLWENLFLFHFSVEVSNANGQTLCQKIAEIRKMLDNESAFALSVFNSKLFEAGYSDKHESLYQDRFYQVRKEDYYKIENEFPRIKENELRSGVCDVEYSIVIAMCDEFLVSEGQLFSTIISL